MEVAAACREVVECNGEVDLEVHRSERGILALEELEAADHIKEQLDKPSGHHPMVQHRIVVGSLKVGLHIEAFEEDYHVV